MLRLRLMLAAVSSVAMGISLIATASPAASAPSQGGLEHRHVRACPDSSHHEVRCYAIIRETITPSGAVEPRAASPYGLSPASVKRAYGFPSGDTAGAGTTVAIVDAFDAPTIEADLATFSEQYGLPDCTTANGCFTKVNQTGGNSYPAVDTGWAVEISLDVEWVHSIAPGANILLVEATTAGVSDLVVAEDYAASQAQYVSNSWGTSEFNFESSFDQHFTHAGTSFFVSSGDNGTPAEWPSSSPNVVSVGGTTLNLNADGTVASETAWTGSGGGCSKWEDANPDQNTGSIDCSGKRATPDVSLVADPDTGVSVYDSTPDNGSTGWIQVGGTSASAPMWAARSAVANTVVDAAYVYGESVRYRDIVSGSNGEPASAGYDLATGRGSWIDPPDAPSGLQAVAGDGAASLAWTAPAAGTVTAYNVYRSTTGTPALIHTTTSPSYHDTGLSNGTTYAYTVTALNDTAEGPAAGPVEVTPAPAPTISGFLPANGLPGDSVEITGAGFTGASQVTFNGSAATFTVDDDSSITTTVPPGATGGPLAVTTSSGTGTSAQSFVVGCGRAWRAEYFANRTLSGVPSAVRCETAVDNSWGTGGPAGVGVGTDNFSVRWTQVHDFGAGGSYTFTATGDDGIRVLLDGVTVVDGWGDHGPTTYVAAAAIPAGSHTVTVEYYEHFGGATARASFAAACPDGQWRAEYFANRTLSGVPSAVRCETAVDNSWGTGGPTGVGVGTDNFSVRWTQVHDFGAGGSYTFTATGDDGIRVLLDGVTVVDGWGDHGPTTYVAAAAIPAGSHTVTVEYYEHFGGATARASFAAACPDGQWRAEYFANRALSGVPSGVRCDAAVDNSWGAGGPTGVGVGTDNFSVRWTQVHDFGAGGNYTFTATGDDGIRVLLDGATVVDGWGDHGPTAYVAAAAIPAGSHTVTVEYYEHFGAATAQASFAAAEALF